MESRIQRLTRIIDDMQEFKKIISDDSDEQTAMIESYRYLVIHLKQLSRGLIPKEIAELIEKIDDDFEDVYELYRAIAYVDVIGSSLNQVGRLNCNFPSLRYIISMRFFVVLKPLALLFAD